MSSKVGQRGYNISDAGGFQVYRRRKRRRSVFPFDPLTTLSLVNARAERKLPSSLEPSRIRTNVVVVCRRRRHRRRRAVVFISYLTACSHTSCLRYIVINYFSFYINSFCCCRQFFTCFFFMFK